MTKVMTVGGTEKHVMTFNQHCHRKRYIRYGYRYPYIDCLGMIRLEKPSHFSWFTCWETGGFLGEKMVKLHARMLCMANSSQREKASGQNQLLCRSCPVYRPVEMPLAKPVSAHICKASFGRAPCLNCIRQPSDFRVRGSKINGWFKLACQ